MKKKIYQKPNLSFALLPVVDVLLSSIVVGEGQEDYFGPNPFEPPADNS